MFLNLEYEMKKNKYCPDDLAVLLKKSKKAATNRLSGKVNFTRNEMVAVKKKWFPELTLDYLFETDEDEEDI